MLMMAYVRSGKTCEKVEASCRVRFKAATAAEDEMTSDARGAPKTRRDLFFVPLRAVCGGIVAADLRADRRFAMALPATHTLLR